MDDRKRWIDAIAAIEIIIKNATRTNKSFGLVSTLNMARSAMIKQIPRTPRNKIREPVCPACYKDIPLEPIDHSKVTYCIHCGQAISWEEWKYGK